MDIATLNQARKALFLEDQPDTALSLLAPLLESRADLSAEDERPVVELAGLCYERKHLFDQACDLFYSIMDYYQAGYCLMLKGHPEKATEHWKHLLMMRPNHWCLTLYGLVTSSLNCIPTFLQIRNHLEADIVHLTRAGQTIMTNQLLLYVDLLSDVNYEAYKFAGRGLFNAGRIKDAGPYLLKGQRILPNDPEIYYHLGQYYHAIGELKQASMMLRQCLMINATYTPARWLLDKINALETV